MVSGATVREEGPRLEFNRLVRESQSMVYSIAYHFLRDRDRAEDLAQDVYMQLYRDLDRIESHEHAIRWLRKVTVHRSIDYARRHARHAEVDIGQIPEPSIPPERTDPLLLEWLRKLVASLPEKRRMLVILRYQEEMALDEIAKLMDMPPPTVRTQLLRTMAHLREKAGHLISEVKP